MSILGCEESSAACQDAPRSSDQPTNCPDSTISARKQHAGHNGTRSQSVTTRTTKEMGEDTWAQRARRTSMEPAELPSCAALWKHLFLGLIIAFTALICLVLAPFLLRLQSHQTCRSWPRGWQIWSSACSAYALGTGEFVTPGLYLTVTFLCSQLNIPWLKPQI